MRYHQDDTYLLREILEAQRETNHLLRKLIKEENRNPTGLSITQIGDATMALQQFDPGATGIVLVAAFTPTGSTPPNSGFSAVWTDSNNFCTFQNDPSDQSGLTQDVSVGSTATVGTSGVITATVTGTFPDGTAANLGGTFNYTIGAPPVGNATGLGITQAK